MGGEFGEECIHVYAWLRPFLFHLKLSQIVRYTPLSNVFGVKKVKTHMCHEEPTGLWDFSRQGLLREQLLL